MIYLIYFKPIALNTAAINWHKVMAVHPFFIASLKMNLLGYFPEQKLVWWLVKFLY